MELSENLKLRLDNVAGHTQQDKTARPTDPNTTELGPIDEAESQMRKALGLLGEGQRHRSESERPEQSGRLGDRFNGGLHRRRFVQDGDIPVTVVRREQGHEQPAHRGLSPASAPSNNRLQRAEAALVAETSAREKAERALAEANSLARDLQTKIGHAELTKAEAIETARKEREAFAQVRADAEAAHDQLRQALAQVQAAEQALETSQQQLSMERQARKDAEKALHAAEAAREDAEQLVHSLSEEASRARRPEPVRRPRSEPEVTAATSRRQRATSAAPVAEPEPVKWWLNSKPVTKRR